MSKLVKDLKLTDTIADANFATAMALALGGMKIILKNTDYLFDASQKIVVFNYNLNLNLQKIYLVTNLADNIIIYNPFTTGYGGTFFNNVLTLDYDTSSMDDTDDLQVIADVEEAEEIIINKGLHGSITDVLAQHEDAGSNYDTINELLTYDTNLEKVFGSQRLLNQKNRLEVDAANISDVVVNGRMMKANDEVVINLDGHQTVAVQFSGTWAGTQSFYATVDGITWIAIYGSNIAVLTAQVASTTASTTVFVFSVAGMKAFKVQTTAYTSGTCIATLRASTGVTNFKSQYVSAAGSVGALTQRATSSELLTYDNPSAQLSHFLGLQIWNPNCTTYAAGDWVIFNNQIYQCIAAPGATVANILPTNTTYWTRDVRGNRNLITNQTISPPDTNRMRVEIDMDDYSIRLQEEIYLLNRLSLLRDMIQFDGEQRDYSKFNSFFQELR